MALARHVRDSPDRGHAFSFGLDPSGIAGRVSREVRQRKKRKILLTRAGNCCIYNIGANLMKRDTLTKTVDTIASECLAVRIRLLNRTVTNIFDEALRPLGVKVSQLNVLMVVAKYGPIAPGEVARRLNMEKSTLSRNLDRMGIHGWFNVAEGDSGRKRVLELAAPGRKLIQKSLPLWKKAQAQTEAVLGQRGARSMHRVANTVWAQLGRE